MKRTKYIYFINADICRYYVLSHKNISYFYFKERLSIFNQYENM